MADDGTILIGKSAKPEELLLKFANRHGLITGATGTGKTVTLQVLAEGFARHGVPVFAADIKGDLSGVAALGDSKPPFVKRAKELDIPYEPDQFTTVFWDVFGEQGHPVRATISEMGPLLLARACSISTTPRRACSTSPSASPTNRSCCCSISRTCARSSTFIAENASGR
jgi:hypothetical protein